MTFDSVTIDDLHVRWMVRQDLHIIEQMGKIGSEQHNPFFEIESMTDYLSSPNKIGLVCYYIHGDYDYIVGATFYQKKKKCFHIDVLLGTDMTIERQLNYLKDKMLRRDDINKISSWVNEEMLDILNLLKSNGYLATGIAANGFGDRDAIIMELDKRSELCQV